MIEPKILYLTFDNIDVFATPHRTIGLVITSSSPETGLAPGLFPGIELTPIEARRLADKLLKMVSLAEDGLPRA